MFPLTPSHRPFPVSLRHPAAQAFSQAMEGIASVFSRHSSPCLLSAAATAMSAAAEASPGELREQAVEQWAGMWGATVAEVKRLGREMKVRRRRIRGGGMKGDGGG